MPTLAYVFWHNPLTGIGSAEYEAAHRGFCDALQATPVPGLAAIRVHRVAPLPWFAAGGYEDWYLMAGSATLDALNAAAIDQARLAAHDRIARLAAHGAAGLYSLRLGEAIEPASAYWFNKPQGMTYADFFKSLQSFCGDYACLWGRQMVLGPTPEFCLHGPVGLKLPYAPQVVELTTVSRQPG